MEEGRKSVLVAALSTYADLLAKSTSEVDRALGKGKAKASDDDVDVQAERLDQLKLCGQLIAEATTCEDEDLGCGKSDNGLPKGSIPGSYHRERRSSSNSMRAKRTSSAPKYQRHTEEYIDPFTGLPVLQETGFEPGPSTKLARPIRTSSWKSAAFHPKISQNALREPAPLTRAASLPIERKPLTQPRPSEHENNWSPRRSERSISYPHSDRISTSTPSRSDSRARRRVDERHVDEAGEAPIHADNDTYMGRISNLTSKALKSAGNMLGLNPTPPVYEAPPMRAGSLIHAPRKSRDDVQFLMTSPQRVASARSKKRGESPPPAYDTLSHSAFSPPTASVTNKRSKNQKVEVRSGSTGAVLTDDEAFARALQEEEYREIQKEQDMLLAQSLANGTADGEDVKLAHFMAREYASLISPTSKTTSRIQPFAPSSTSKKPPEIDLSQWDAQTRQMQLDHLYALEISKSLSAEEEANDTSWVAAIRLQAEFDREEQSHEAWEAYKKTNFEECVVCGDENHREEFLRPCEHGYCESCLQEGFKNALKSKTLLKCCKKNLSVDDCTGLGTKFVEGYKELVLELTTKNPMYCCNASCAKFLPPSAIVGEIGTCKGCKTQTCRHCRKLVHPGVFCEEDQETKAVKELALQKGWKMCPGCNHLIERQSGCLHMICSRCQTAFCYRCSKRWNDCESTCPDPISATHPKYPGRG